MSTPARIQTGTLLLDADAIERTLSRIAHEIVERNPELDRVALVGIHTRGVPLARRLRRLIAEYAGVELALGAIDITFHRDDVHVRGGEAPLRAQPLVRGPGPGGMNAGCPNMQAYRGDQGHSTEAPVFISRPGPKIVTEMRPPERPPRRHLISTADLCRDDVERLLATARSFESSLDR